MLVVAELAKEKLARMCEDLRETSEFHGNALPLEVRAHNDGVMHCARLIRNTDLTDCQQTADGEIRPNSDLGNNPSATPSGRRWECRAANPFLDKIDDYGLFSVKPFAIGQTVGELIYAEDAIAGRIAACLNACEGIPTEDLERWGISLIDKIREDELAPSPDWRAEFEAARLQFQRETLRTSELSQLLRKFIEQHHGEHEPGPWSRSCELCALVGEAKALLLKPLNALTTEGNARGSSRDTGSGINKEVGAPDQGSVRNATDMRERCAKVVAARIETDCLEGNCEFCDLLRDRVAAIRALPVLEAHQKD